MFSKQDIEKYFLAEKQLSLAIIVTGSIAIALALIFLLALKTSFFKGTALPLLVIGLLQLAAGIAVYKTADKDRIRNVYALDMNPSQLKNEEVPRMQQVLKKFAIIKWVEAALVVTGLLLIYYNRANVNQAFWYGLGITLTIQVVIMLFADYSAEKRAQQYTKGLESRVKQD